MNSYSENLQQTVSKTLSSLYADQQKIESGQRSAEYNLYYAQGAQISSGDHLAQTDLELAEAQSLNDKGVLCDNAAVNLLDTATVLQSNTTTAISNVAAAAANIKTASNSISTVAANIGSALNIALASCYDTDIYKKTLQANNYISVTANEAEYASQLAMEASSQCSELMSADVLSNVTASKAALEQLLTELSTDVTNLSTQSATDFQTFNADKKAERKAEGVLKDADSQLLGVNESVLAANSQLNLNINWVLSSANASVVVSSDKYEAPFALTSGAGNQPVQTVENQYVFFAKASSQSSVTLEQIETLFGEYYTSANTGNLNRFYVMSEGATPELEVSSACLYTPNDTSATKDIDGDYLSPGQEYVAFVYVELTLAYQRYIGVYDNIISSASASFTPTLPLPVVSSTSIQGSTITVDLEPGSQAIATNLSVDLHVMLLPKNKPDEAHLMTSSDSSVLPFYFNVSIAQQVSSANYIKGTVDFQNQDTTETVDIIADTTDNFGCPLIDDIDYYIGVLCQPTEAQYLSQYLPTLYISTSPFTFGHTTTSLLLKLLNVTHLNNTGHTSQSSSMSTSAPSLTSSASPKAKDSAEPETDATSDNSATDSTSDTASAKKSNKEKK
ncbi:hypothetical protein [Pseudoalteromonas byunsanensis]|uniref:Uncharacterized protein n=1 Tax=Pseudoalteromonas byunsanensis TaxID=327939 RepID=A0A1S1N4J3_9GAMM|nr:hypothetical protein [Pseudoalteromonas byunsanensis]OHU93541.1 hypothetical protein BIW53_19550 [Pseudoalteromonas byunsanensis]